jgi:hypothetical protein
VLQIRGSDSDVVIVDIVSTTAEWLLEISGLTVGARDGVTSDIEAQGRALAQQLQVCAADFLQVTECDGSGCGPGCALLGVDGGHAACRLAVILQGGSPPPTGRSISRGRATQQYLQSIRAASTAVFHCRRHAHPAAECWFSEDGFDVCGDVLAAAHRLGG